MSSYSVGTCSVTVGSQIVTFTGVDLSYISVGDLFRLSTENTFYTISSKDISNNTITLSLPYSNSENVLYSSDEVLGTGTSLEDEFSGNLANTPVVAGSVEITDGVAAATKVTYFKSKPEYIKYK